MKLKVRSYYFEEKLKKKLSILSRKDPKRYLILMKKVEEIITCNNVDRYKSLRKPLQNFKRVHIDAHFVLVFKYEKNKDVVFFYDFDHHDNIYK
jgi:YafQ family addiction module toxin component